MKKIINSAVFLSLILILGSCSTSKLLPIDTSNNAKNIKSCEDKALVYVFRKSALGAAIGIRVDMRVDMNTFPLATFYPKKFYLCALEPGKYVFTGHAENTDRMILNVEKGKKYYVEVIPQMGLVIASCKLALNDSIDGDKKVQKCKLIGLNIGAQELLKYSPTK